MKVHPNETNVTAKVKKLSPCVDGQGFEVDLEIGENRSPNPSEDFLKPQSGDLVRAYSASIDGLSVGLNVQALLSLSAGPFQQRTILRKVEPITPSR